MFESARTTAHPAIGDFTWQRLGNPQLTPARIADKGRRSIRRLREWGVEVPSNCRLARATELIDQDIIWADGEEEEKLVSDFTTGRLSGLREWMRDNL